MKYKFRGYSDTLKRWVYGTSVYQTSRGVEIFNTEACGHKTQVNPDTFGKCWILQDAHNTEVYQGDILRYAFVQDGIMYNRYYKIIEDEYGVRGEELWRDYDLDPETLEVSRYHSYKFKGTIVELSYFNTSKPCKKVGTIWQNPEYL